MSKMFHRSDGSVLMGDWLLPKHQNKILLHLAKKGAMTMSQANRDIKGENTSTTRAFHELKSKKLITEIGTTEYHGRKFSKYWLSGRGIAYAFLHDVNPEIVSKNASYYLKDKTIEIYLKLHARDHHTANRLDYQIFHSGKVDPKDLAEDMIDYVVSEVNVEHLDDTETQKLLSTIKLTEEFYSEWKLNRERLKRELEDTKKLLEFLDKIEKINDKIEKIKEE